jgi:hypothetical protein
MKIERGEWTRIPLPVVSADFTICCILWDPFTSPRTAQKFIKYFRQMKNGFSNQRVGIEKKIEWKREGERFERGKILLRDVQIRDDGWRDPDCSRMTPWYGMGQRTSSSRAGLTMMSLPWLEWHQNKDEQVWRKNSDKRDVPAWDVPECNWDKNR